MTRRTDSYTPKSYISTLSRTISFLPPRLNQTGGSSLTRTLVHNKLAYLFLFVGVSLFALTWAMLIEWSLPTHLAIILVIGGMSALIIFAVFSARLRPSLSVVCPDCGYRNLKDAELCTRCGRKLR